MEHETNVIYAFFDGQDQPFYIGRTNNFAKRSRRHKLEVGWGTKLYKYNKLRKVLKSGVPLEKAIRVIEDGISDKKIHARERWWITELKRQGRKLTNLTEGGDSGFRWTEEHRKNHSKALMGHVITPETRKRISMANKGKKFSAEHRRKLSIARRKRVTTQETREKMRKSMKGKRNIKVYKVTSPQGEVYTTTRGLSLFCEQYNLTPSNMVKVANGYRPRHKGWTCERIDPA